MYSGIVNVYKQQGFTSHDVVAKLRGIYGQKKIGHTGTLDPMAEGVLIVCLGQATKLSGLILSSSKEYRATMKLGVVTDTDDITGKVLNSMDGLSEQSSVMGSSLVNKLFSDKDAFRQKILEVMNKHLGKSMQIPPKYSAIKVDGKKLYEYARAGIEIEIKPRPIEIFSLELQDINYETAEITFDVKCSKGTYIRSLIRDMGEDLGVGATMSGLLRNEVNGLKAEDGFTIDALQRLREEDDLGKSVMSMDALLNGFAAVNVRPEAEKMLVNGNRLGVEDIEIVSDITEQELWQKEFFRVYLGNELKALYAYDASKNNYKVYKML
ncbi:MAG: tRNA pseudouridine(55) synthase TruB [Eubacterium sp.]|nr:tRNA pseudouridine(55) synthase TruB [Eubacterium sp.]